MDTIFHYNYFVKHKYFYLIMTMNLKHIYNELVFTALLAVLHKILYKDNPVIMPKLN